MSEPSPPALPFYPPARGRAQTAATWAWVVGGIEVVIFGGCAGCFTIGAFVPNETYQGVPLPPGMTLDLLRVSMVVLAVVLTVVLVLPGIALLVLGFGVMKGKNGQRQAARAILITQAALIGGIVVLNLLASAMSGQLAGALVQAVLMGGLVALQLFAARALSASLQPGRSSARHGIAGGVGRDDDFDEPWNSHLQN